MELVKLCPDQTLVTALTKGKALEANAKAAELSLLLPLLLLFSASRAARA